MYVDIETTPNLAYVYSLWRETIPLQRLVESAQVLCVGWKWRGSKDFHFAGDNTGHAEMVHAVHAALSEADLVVHFNGKSFDIPHLNREFLLAGLPQPAPYAQLDLYREIRKQFRFTSNKLEHVLETLDLDTKVKHSGFNLWVRCMAGEASAWEEMKQYNKRDVLALEDLHERMKGWLPGSPNAGLYSDSDEPACPQCGSTDLRKEGHSYALTGVYQRWQCRACGAWSQSTRRERGVEVRGVL